VSALLEQARVWIEPYWNAEHLRRTLDWLLVLEPDASEALRLAAITHDIERHYPGGPVFDPGTMSPREEEYARTHSERSARIVGDWLHQHGASPDLIRDVQELILVHEIGGTPAADALQAADSVSFLETNAGLVCGWVDQRRCSIERAKQQHVYMFQRIRIERAKELARPFYAQALAALDEREAA
jgi:hypothetical protein